MAPLLAPTTSPNPVSRLIPPELDVCELDCPPTISIDPPFIISDEPAFNKMLPPFLLLLSTERTILLIVDSVSRDKPVRT